MWAIDWLRYGNGYRRKTSMIIKVNRCISGFHLFKGPVNLNAKCGDRKWENHKKEAEGKFYSVKNVSIFLFCLSFRGVIKKNNFKMLKIIRKETELSWELYIYFIRKFLSNSHFSQERKCPCPVKRKVFTMNAILLPIT